MSAVCLSGPGSLSRLPDALPPKAKIMLITGNSSGNIPSVRHFQESMGTRIAVAITGVHAEPTTDQAAALTAAGRKAGVDCIVAIGGGSVIDSGKAASALIPAEGGILDYFYGRKSLPGKSIFFAAVPTTAGTGAESTNNAVLIDPATLVKQSLRHPEMVPDLAVSDPELLLGAPFSVTAFSGLDAYVQSFEGFTSPKASEETRKDAAEAVRLIYENLEKACRNPQDMESRIHLAYASLISGRAFAKTGLGAVHGFAHPAGALLHLPHGKACAVLMGPVMRFNAPVCGRDYEYLGNLIGNSDFIDASVRLASRLGVHPSLKEYGMKERDIPFILENCRSGSMKNNPRPVSDEEGGIILRELL